MEFLTVWPLPADDADVDTLAQLLVDAQRLALLSVALSSTLSKLREIWTRPARAPRPS